MVTFPVPGGWPDPELMGTAPTRLDRVYPLGLPATGILQHAAAAHLAGNRGSPALLLRGEAPTLARRTGRNGIEAAP